MGLLMQCVGVRLVGRRSELGGRAGAEIRTDGGARRGAASTRRALGQVCPHEGTNLCEELPKHEILCEFLKIESNVLIIVDDGMEEVIR